MFMPKLYFCTCLFVASLAHINVALSEEYFGEFIGTAVLSQIDDDGNRPRFKLVNEFTFIDPNEFKWVVPEGYEPLDGASIPKGFWSIVGGPFSGNYFKASIIHDYYSQIKTRTDHDTHRNFYYAMRAGGVPQYQALPMYLAVVAFGPKWKNGIRRRQCLSEDNNISCNFVPDAEDIESTIDLSLPPVGSGDELELAQKFHEAVELALSVESGNGNNETSALVSENVRLEILDNASAKLREGAL